METTLSCMSKVAESMETMGISVQNVCGVGVTNQRETTVVWDRHTGKPLHNAIFTAIFWR